MHNMIIRNRTTKTAKPSPLYSRGSATTLGQRKSLPALFEGMEFSPLGELEGA